MNTVKMNMIVGKMRQCRHTVLIRYFEDKVYL